MKKLLGKGLFFLTIEEMQHPRTHYMAGAKLGKVLIATYENDGYYNPSSKLFKEWNVKNLLPGYNRATGHDTEEECIEHIKDIARDYFNKLKNK